MPRVVHCEIAADDPERAAAFYRTGFGWHIQSRLALPWGGRRCDGRPGPWPGIG
jgi:predicted enzyme related to lactoylglutathione lyase